MRKKGKKVDDAVKEHERINIKILELRDNILEEFDMLELVEDSIKDIFSCDLNCVTCSNDERGKCMQSFKKANIYWLRKISQDEWMIKDVVDKIDGMRESLVKMMEIQKEYFANNSGNSAKFKEHKDKIKNKLKNNHGYNIYS
jgi:hypothetical protein